MCVKRSQAFLHLSVLRTTTLSNSSGPGIYRRCIGQYRIQELPEREALYQTASSQFGVAPGQSRAALVLYSDSAFVKAGFDQYPTLEEFHKSVDDLPYENGFTRIDLALEKANQEVFPQARKGVPKIAILITDGKQTKAADSKGLREASEPLRRAGVRVLAVGIGSDVDSDELRL